MNEEERLHLIEQSVLYVKLMIWAQPGVPGTTITSFDWKKQVG